MKKEVFVCEFVEELLRRMEESKDINCCKEEIKTFCTFAVAKLGEEKISIDWKD